MGLVNKAISSYNVFAEYLEKETLFKNKKALTSAFIPEKIPHREAEIRHLIDVLAPVLRGYATNNVFIYGTVGTGKTICCRFVLTQLQEAAAAQQKSVRTAYLNCKLKKIADTEYRLIAQLLRCFGETVPDTGLPTDALYRRFFEKVDEKKQHIVIALDEIDSLFKKTGDEFLYNLTRMNAELRNSTVTIVGITNDTSFRDALDVRVKSSLSEEEIVFKPYDAMQLRDILQGRVEDGFRKDAVSEDVVGMCAAIAAQEHGDARRALDLIRIAGEIAERNGDAKVTDYHIRDAEEKLDVDRVLEIVKAQPRHSQAVLLSIIALSAAQKASGRWADRRLLTGNVFEKYREICERNGTKTLTQRRLSDLIGELDMLGIISANVVSKGRYGRTREISLALTEPLVGRVERTLAEKLL